jgi:hypothetical protein
VWLVALVVAAVLLLPGQQVVRVPQGRVLRVVRLHGTVAFIHAAAGVALPR